MPKRSETEKKKHAVNKKTPDRRNKINKKRNIKKVGSYPLMMYQYPMMHYNPYQVYKPIEKTTKRYTYEELAQKTGNKSYMNDHRIYMQNAKNKRFDTYYILDGKIYYSKKSIQQLPYAVDAERRTQPRVLATRPHMLTSSKTAQTHAPQRLKSIPENNTVESRTPVGNRPLKPEEQKKVSDIANFWKKETKDNNITRKDLEEAYNRGEIYGGMHKRKRNLKIKNIHK